MKNIRRIFALGVLGCLATTGASSALAQDMDECRGGYRMMLMTPAECQTYLQQLQKVRARSDRLAELELREWHTSLLIERAEACPCRAGEHFVLYQRVSGAQRPRTNQAY
ncbi:MAG: hypothetical protein MUE59_02305 [Thiobacillaceae bacterium]|jgi:hypothetical protein|nr:hypothetical protein [Thiobacillaceae bacterium]